MQILPYRLGKDARRFFGKSPERGSIGFLLGNIGNANKWNKLNHSGKPLYMTQQRYFSEKHSIASIAKGLLDTFPHVAQQVIEDPKYNDVPEAVSCFKDTLERVIPAGMDHLTICFVHCYLSMEEPKNITPEKIKIMHIFAWCFQMLQVSTVIVDDIVDGAEYRVGKKCWHMEEDVGSRAIIDNVLIEVQIFRLLKKYCSHLPMYIPVVQLWHHTLLKVAIGLYLDAMVLQRNGLTLSHYTRKRYETLVKYKTTTAAFKLPYTLSRYLSGNYHTEISPEIKEMLIMLGHFFQIQNDFRDIYDAGYESKKSTNDIANGRGTWVITTALERANHEQRRILETHFGKKNVESVQIVKDVYDHLGIPKIYAKIEKEVFDFIEKNYEQVSKLTCLELATKRLNYVYEKYL